MFAKSTIPLFVLVVGLLSFLSGSASAYPHYYRTTTQPRVVDDASHLFEEFFQRKPEATHGAVTYLHENAIQGNNMGGKNYFASQLYQKDVTVRGKIPSTTQIFGPVTFGTFNAIQQSNSDSTNVLGSKVVMNDVRYDFRN